jgi:catechol 2,3-dioxygenase-like lactoylglutathione lyase family enzyme
LGDKIEMQMPGVDSMQALMLAIHGISRYIRHEALDLAWDFDGELGVPGEVGIPYAILFADGLDPGTTYSTVDLQAQVERALEDHDRQIGKANERFVMGSRQRPRPFAAIDHVQLAMPSGAEDQARSFYSGILGMTEIKKPDALKERGGVWFGSGITQIHLGVDPDFKPAKKAHPALRCREYRVLIEKLVKAGVEVRADPMLLPDGSQHAYIDDPFGNRLELIAEF